MEFSEALKWMLQSRDNHCIFDGGCTYRMGDGLEYYNEGLGDWFPSNISATTAIAYHWNKVVKPELLWSRMTLDSKGVYEDPSMWFTSKEAFMEFHTNWEGRDGEYIMSYGDWVSKPIPIMTSK